jgi:hypothetical protein
MDCEDFREHIFEQKTKKLSTAEIKDFDAHHQDCASCRDALHDWQQIESVLRASWASEEPQVPFFVPPARAHQSSWLYNVRNWVSAASTAVLAASLLLVVLLRPSVQYNRHELSFRFGQTSPASEAPSAQSVSQVQVEAWARAAVGQVVAQETARLQSASHSVSDSPSAEESRNLARMGVELEMLKETEASLWQQVQQHGLYLQSAWQRPSQPIGPNQVPSVSPQ